MQEPLFDTIDGRTFYFDTDRQLFLSGSPKTELQEERAFYLGSIVPDNEEFKLTTLVGHDLLPARLFSRQQAEIVIDDFVTHKINRYGTCWFDTIPGYTPQFSVGNYLFGVSRRGSENVIPEKDHLALASNAMLYLGPKINAVHQQIFGLPPSPAYSNRENSKAA